MLTIFLGVLIGLALGLTGGGGSLFAVPLLIYVLHVEPQSAITISLAAVTTMALFGSIEASLNKMVEWRACLIFAVGGIICAPLGIYIANSISEKLLVMGFAALMVFIAVSMWYRTMKKSDQAAVVRVNYGKMIEGSGAICMLDNNQSIRLSAPCSFALIFCGCATGVLSGLFGVGGGFLIVPALTFVTQLNIHRAVASSLLIISLIGISGMSAAFYLGRTISLDITGIFIVGGLIGMFIGRLIASHVSTLHLQKVFSLFIFIIGLTSLLTNI